jgi:hypothetical protein
MKTVMNKTLYKTTQKLLQKHRQGGRVKKSVSVRKLYEEYHFGQFDLNKEWLTFSLENILALSKEIQDSTLRVDIRHDPYPDEEDRRIIAEKSRNEKVNSYPVSKDFILINSLSELRINQTRHTIVPITSLGIYVCADDVKSIEHKSIVFVENLAVMASLSALNFSTLTENLAEALWVYRGDIRKQQSTSTAYQFFRRFKNNQRICFSDVDPKGIEIAITSDADYWLTIERIEDFKNTINFLEGSEEEWFKQRGSIEFLRKEQVKQGVLLQNKLAWETIFTASLANQKTLKQEHIIAHHLPLTLLKI